jgi:2-polyprenyl-3-methyl-5-hydroxy-6-metoxy-1,4-benzoquinol methylase
MKMENNGIGGVKVMDGSGVSETSMAWKDGGINETSVAWEESAAVGRRVCPPGHVRVMDNFLRPLFHNTRKLFGPYVQPGMSVLDVGCGGGFASMGLARLVGEDGQVIAADLQPEMLSIVEERAREAALTDRVRIHRCNAYGVGLKEEVDFAVAFWMVHEVPDVRAFFAEMFALLRPGGNFFVAEPRFHVSRADFEALVETAEDTGFTVADRPRVRLSRALVLAA